MTTCLQKPHEDLIYQALSTDEGALLDIKNIQFFTLNATAKRIFEAASKGTHINEIVHLLRQEFNVDEAQCRADVESMLLEFQERGILESR